MMFSSKIGMIYKNCTRKVEYHIPLSWSTRVSLRRRMTEMLYVRKVD